ncbi:Glutamate-ammonia-ligase adenylyltransferase [Posidoniimonas polymericola]|uniref:Glutamate-ammonia-ligase adenylyltransferase n=1 Tax=Posidoniimonas polymericola TaxID=2528002 RepID=A0A5C5ZGU6_9BACT|nr:bifunctional [glutamate--ammonia ligase]-adenylyl-L-tyrosine phosphorylase/[glutamate--ammonia-ligase] adenylyltransferase [Posidoniimonas polymericola]TWT85773.1 Glutamate-ammonia-ligase adenylyltransferase [Posidoniimonas polymericola]
MQLDTLCNYLDDTSSAGTWLQSIGIARIDSGHRNLVMMAEAGVPLDLLANLCDQFAAAAPILADRDMAWNNLERFVSGARNPLSTTALFERDSEALPNLLQLFSTSQYLSDILVRDQEAYDLLRMTEGRPVARDVLVDELRPDLASITTRDEALAALRRHKQRETLRIAYGDIVRNHSVATVSRQVSFLADALVEAALGFARRQLEQKYGVPRWGQGDAVRFCVLALGKLGGIELNYSSDIDLILLYDHDGATDGARSISNREFFERLSRDLVKLLSENTDSGVAFRVDLRLRPEGSRGPVCSSLEQMLAYYDNKGRTWERQAFIKARSIAGDVSLGDELLGRLEPWVYRRYLSLADITGIKSLKQRIEHRAKSEGDDLRNVKTGHGGIRDIEFVIQFLQLLNGGTLAELRTGNTLDAITQLDKVGCLTPQERSLLEDNYCQLRKLEHRLQIMYDLQTHNLPESDDELRKVAIRMGYADTPPRSALDSFREDLAELREVNRRILDHLLHDAYVGDGQEEPEVDLINDPDPTPERIQEVLGKYPFRDVPAAYANLMALATEKIRFLSTRRCRHFLASISPRLLPAIAQTPEPDTTLVNLSRVSDSIGGKAALWELFSENNASLNLYVTLCAACPYLAGILTSNPGMIDDLLDSLLVEGLPTLARLKSALAELTRGAEDQELILHSFKNAQHLRVGVRDILGKDDVSATHAALSDIAEACLDAIITTEHAALVEKYGAPTIVLPDDPELAPAALAGRDGQPCGFIVLALGKLGGGEPNYHSDLDLVFLYEHEGRTQPGGRASEGTTNGHFFSELTQRIIKAAGHLGPHGRLYEVDARLRPTGRGGSLAMPVDAFLRYFEDGVGQLWERQALCKARVVHGAPAAAEYALQAVWQAAFGPEWRQEQAEEIGQMRLRLEETASPHNLKRGRGGTMDTEFLVQMLQLKHGGSDPSIRVTGTLAALAALHDRGYLADDDFEHFSESYRFQRSVEARIRLMDSLGRHELPTDEAELRKLAFLLGGGDGERLARRAAEYFDENRRRFEKLFGA